MLKKIRVDLNQAMKKKDALKVATLRLLLAEIHNQEMDKQSELIDEEILGVVRKEVKKRQEAIGLYRQGERDDLVQKEQQELDILKKYLPQEMSSEELEKVVKETMVDVRASGPQDFGQVMGAVLGKLKGKADGKRVAEMVEDLLKSAA